MHKKSFVQTAAGTFFICTALVLLFSTGHAAEKKKTDYFGSLKKKLTKDGFYKEEIDWLYGRKEIRFDVKGVSLYFVHQESKLDYGQFTKKKSLKNAKAYLKKYKDEFESAEKAFGVDRQIIAAIILVESRFGTYFGRRKVVNTLSTMSALMDKDVREALWKKIEKKTTLTKNQYAEKAKKKSTWAYDELKAFLLYTWDEKIDPCQINGSYAGAMGIPQFMPSNIRKFAKDGDGNGSVDLFNHADAIMSVASYLSHYGWKSGITEKKAFKVVYEYNHSKYYVNTILKIAKLLKG